MVGTITATTAGTAPAITSPSNQSVTAGATATFTVVATGNPGPTYQWPFGAIDTPGQGHTISGVFNNFGWVLTPDGNDRQ